MVVIRGMNVYPSAIEEAVRHASRAPASSGSPSTPSRSGMDEVKLEVELADGTTRARAPGDDAPAARAARARRAGRARASCRGTTARRAGWSTSARRGGSRRERPEGGLARRARPRPRLIRGASEQVAVQIQHYIQEEGLGPGDFLGPRGGPRGRVRGQPPDAARGAQAARQRQPDPRHQGAGRRHLRRAHRRAGHGPEPQRRDRDDARDRRGHACEELLDARLLLEVPLAGLAAYQPDDETLGRLRSAVDARGRRARRPGGASPRLTARSTGRSPRRPATG